MKPYLHAISSAKRHGGKPEDYQEIHDFIDSSKQAFPGVQHRAILHNAFGIFLAEKVFGTTITNSDAKKIQVRDIAEYHVFQDLGTIPTVEDWVKNIPVQPWMVGPSASNTRIRKISYVD